MKTYFRSCLCISLLLSAAAVHADERCDDSCESKQRALSTIVQHPHHDLLEHQNHYRNYVYGEEDCFSLKFNFTYQYDHSFNEDENLTCALFGRAAQPGTTSTSTSSSSSVNCDSECNNCESILIQGQSVNNRNQNALRAEEFGLGPDTDARVAFEPEIENHLFNFQMYMNLGELIEGLYAQVDLPLVHSKWDLCGDDDCRNIISSGGVGNRDFVSGCIDAVSINGGNIQNNASVKDLSAALRGNANFGDKTTNLAWDRIVCGEQDDTQLANLSFSLGYNFWECPDYHMGAYLYVAAPTGTEIGTDQDCARNLFSPVIGSDHWELGGGIQGHFEICNWDDMHTFTMFMQGYAAHAFDEDSRRTFDLANQGQLSRYMLLKEFDSSNNYAGNLIPAANWTTRCVETSIDIKGEGLVEFMYSNGCGLDISLGYGVWGQDNEELENCKSELPGTDMDNRRFGVKGCAPIQAASVDTQATGTQVAVNPTFQAEAMLRSTQSAASMFACGGTTTINDTDGIERTVQVVDNATGNLIQNEQNQKGFDPCVATENGLPTENQRIENVSGVQDSSSPKLLNKDRDIDTASGLTPSMVSHRIFGRLNYTFEDVDFTPYVGLGGFVEFSDDDHPATAERAGFFINGGVSF